MIVLDVEQGSSEWLAARLGIPTASQFGRILTPKTMKLGAGADTYLHELMAEWMLGYTPQDDTTLFMERGQNLELSAVDFYELQRDVDTTKVGFILRNDRSCGASPDRLVGDVGGLEIKCPSAANHVGYLLENDVMKYRAQIQGGLWIAEREWWDFLSFHPDLPPVLTRFERDEPFIAALASAMSEFTDRLAKAKAMMLARGFEPALAA